MTATIVRDENFDPADYRGELDAAPGNLDVGTRLWFENDHIRVWEIRLMPGERGPFHAHTRRYFWTVVDGGIGRQRTTDGTVCGQSFRPEFRAGASPICRAGAAGEPKAGSVVSPPGPRGRTRGQRGDRLGGR